MTASIYTADDGITHISSNLTFETVEALQHDVAKLVSTSKELKVDLSSVAHCDSAGVALLLDCFRQASLKNIKMELLHPSRQIKQIIKICGLQGILL